MSETGSVRGIAEQMEAARKAGLPDVYIRRDWRSWDVRQCGKLIRIFHDTLAPSLNPRDSRAWVLDIAKDITGQWFGVASWKRTRTGEYVDARVFDRFPIKKGKP